MAAKKLLVNVASIKMVIIKLRTLIALIGLVIFFTGYYKGKYSKVKK